MNQILSVEVPKNNVKARREPRKASIKSVIIFFCIILIIFGIALVTLGIITKNERKDIGEQVVPTVVKPRIDIIQNGTLGLEIDVSSENIISEVKYKWNEDEFKYAEANGTNNITININNVPAGTNNLTVIATDINGLSTEYNSQYVGQEEANVTLKFDQNTEKLTAICQDEKVIKSIAYNYDEEEENVQEINNNTAEIEVASVQGEHDLTIRVDYEDGTSKKKTQKIYFPTVTFNIDANYTKFIINASDVRNITKVKINFNGVETEEEVNKESYTKELQLQPGEPGSNKLICTIYNSDGLSITRRIWDKNRQN